MQRRTLHFPSTLQIGVAQSSQREALTFLSCSLTPACVLWGGRLSNVLWNKSWASSLAIWNARSAASKMGFVLTRKAERKGEKRARCLAGRGAELARVTWLDFLKESARRSLDDDRDEVWFLWWYQAQFWSKVWVTLQHSTFRHKIIIALICHTSAISISFEREISKDWNEILLVCNGGR